MDRSRIDALEYELEGIRLRSGEGVAMPARDGAALEGDMRQRYYEGLFNAAKNQHDTSKKMYTIENKLYLDGRVVYESVKNHAKDDSDSSFAGEGVLWSEEA